MTKSEQNLSDGNSYVEETVSQITSKFHEWRPVEQRATKGLWSLLGQIYEAGSKIEGEPAAKKELRHKADKEFGFNNRWDSDGKHSFDLLLSLLLGIKPETKATKSQWLAVLRAASRAGIEAVEQSFSKWLESVGGIVAAIKTKTGPAPLAFDFSSFRHHLLDEAEPEETTIPINMVSDQHEGFSVFLVRRALNPDGQWEQRLDVVAKIGDPKIVERVAKAVSEGEFKNVRPEDVEKVEAACIFNLNRFLWKKHELIRGGLKGSDLKAFVKAIRQLAAIPELAEKYFLGQPSFDVEVNDLKAKSARRSAKN